MEFKLARNNPTEAKDYFEKKLRFTVGPTEVQYYLDKGVPLTIIDVRDKKDFAKGHIPGAINLPEEDWKNQVLLSQGKLSKDKPNVIYCYSIVCHLAAKAAFHFATQGYSVLELEGGYDYWKEYGFKEEKVAA